MSITFKQQYTRARVCEDLRIHARESHVLKNSLPASTHTEICAHARRQISFRNVWRSLLNVICYHHL